MCVPILRSIGTKLTKLENMQISRFIWFIWRHVTQKRYVGTATLLIGILTRNILKPTRSLYDFRFKSYGSNSGFRVFLDLDIWPMFYFCCHTHCAWCTGISMRSFIRILPVWMGDTVQITFIFIGQTHLVFGKRVCTCVTKHSNAFRTFLNWLKNSKRVWHERKLHILRLPIFANFDLWSVSVGWV